VQDYDETWPAGYAIMDPVDTSNNGTLWHDNWARSIDPATNTTTQNFVNKGIHWVGIMQPYVKNTQVFKCPSDSSVHLSSYHPKMSLCAVRAPVAQAAIPYPAEAMMVNEQYHFHEQPGSGHTTSANYALNIAFTEY
jgi:hypothetical protein